MSQEAINSPSLSVGDSVPKYSKKRKLDNSTDLASISQGAEKATTESHRKKKRRNAKRKPGQTEESSGESLQITGANIVKPASALPQSPDAGDSRSQRFIVFIGNLPYTATKEQVSQHFVKLQPTSVRLQTDRITGKSKGFAFIEFAGYDKMKTCLKLYHHSLFDNGKGESRKINVELTAGGGGSKSKERRQKLKDKNQKLDQERARSIQENKKKKADKDTKQEPNSRAPTREDDDQNAIHPSRRQWVPSS